ncbi:MAG TPA: RNA polymerase sigma factor [Actinocrinis sp.]|uniref:RNA polymerase sigma factor n=1 Tax=Actinocrinis sp. TaxID=1920516 RepID=UPI002DDCC650|nr:RNA polymerase sigma factor [Actinocrinis sp.]HEV2346374.1 RNA polymerase sigma factor [Actinocrinis sp.]
MAIPETTLIAQAQNGDTSAFATLYEQTRDELTKAVAAKLHRSGAHPDHADDIVHETYFRAIRGLPDYEDRGRPFIAWLHTIAGFLVLDLLKSSRHRREYTFTHLSSGGDSASDAWFDRPDREHQRPEQQVVRADEFDQLIPLLHKLTDLQREAMLNRYYYGLTVEETAREMGMKAGAVKTLCGRAVTAIRRLHAAEYPSELVRIT